MKQQHIIDLVKNKDVYYEWDHHKKCSEDPSRVI
jgi:hypothetical protein